MARWCPYGFASVGACATLLAAFSTVVSALRNFTLDKQLRYSNLGGNEQFSSYSGVSGLSGADT